MAKLYFRYGAMNSGKTANLLMVADNYINLGRSIIILKPEQDTRWDTTDVKSRAIENPLPAETIHKNQDLYELLKHRLQKENIDAVLVEEAQFLSAMQVRQLAVAVDEFNTPVLCYGLRCSYIDGELFEGSAALFYWADTIEEVKNVCQYCKSKATKNLLRINGVPQYKGTTIIMGDVGTKDEILYSPVCRKHYINPPV